VSGGLALGRSDSSFTLDGVPTFLLGISAMGAVGRLTDAELDWLRERGFNLIRVFGYWTQVMLDSQAPNLPPTLESSILFRPDGSLNPERVEQLVGLLERAAARGIVMDLTVFNAFDSLPDDDQLSVHGAALEALTTALLPHRNLLFDVWNEHNNSDPIHPHPLSHAQAARLFERARAIDPGRLLTISNTHHPRYCRDGLMVDIAGLPDDAAVLRRHRYAPALVAGLRAQLRRVEPERITLAARPPHSGEYDVSRYSEASYWDAITAELREVGVDALTPHLERTVDFADRTGERVRALLDHMRAVGRVVPLYLQEEGRRRHSGLNPEVDDFLRAAINARQAGAASWVFHTDAAYNLALGPLYDQLDPVEAEAAERLARALRDA
jgi:hypothetical protein